jgi:hypothetical protein
MQAALGRTQGQINGKINRLREEGRLNVTEEDSTRVMELQAQLRKAYRKLDDQKWSQGEARRALSEAVRENLHLLELAPAPVPTLLGTGLGTPEVAVVMYSDLQLGKKTPTYNSVIAEERSDRYGDHVTKLVNIQRHAHAVDEVHVWLLGDIVEGELIFPGQAYQIDSGLYRQAIVNGPRIMKKFLDKMLANFKKVHVAAVIGNHGALGGRRLSRDFHPDSNADLFLYEIVRMMYQQAGETRITFDIPLLEGGEYGPWYTVDRIGNYSSMLFHGDQIKGHSTFPWYGFDKKVKGWSVLGNFPEFPMASFRDAACGHWHVPTSFEVNGIEVRVNGTFESYNMYAQMELASMGMPKQRLMLVHPGHGWVTVEHKVYL